MHAHSRMYPDRDAQNNTHTLTAHLVEWSTLECLFQSCIISEMHKTHTSGQHTLWSGHSLHAHSKVVSYQRCTEQHTHPDSTPCGMVTACMPIPGCTLIEMQKTKNTSGQHTLWSGRCLHAHSKVVSYQRCTKHHTHPDSTPCGMATACMPIPGCTLIEMHKTTHPDSTPCGMVTACMPTPGCPLLTFKVKGPEEVSRVVRCAGGNKRRDSWKQASV